MDICYQRIDSPVGLLTVAAHDVGLHAIEFPHERQPRLHAGWRESPHPLIDLAARQLQEYFAGTRHGFELPLAPRGTPFQLAVWLALANIPYGRTTSYAGLAAQLDRPGASRAVGAANGRNPLPIVLPCHRVIGADGSLTGFAGGLAVKRFLLELEGAILPRDLAENLFAAPAQAELA